MLACFAFGPIRSLVADTDGSKASGITISAEPISASGDSIYRWSIDNADASLLVGDCVVHHEGHQLTGSRVLIVADGPVGEVRCRMVVQPHSGQGSKPLVFTIHTLVDPLVQAPRFLGDPHRTIHRTEDLQHSEDRQRTTSASGDDPLSLLQWLPSTDPVRSGSLGYQDDNHESSVQMVQFAQTLPNADPLRLPEDTLPTPGQQQSAELAETNQSQTLPPKPFVPNDDSRQLSDPELLPPGSMKPQVAGPQSANPQSANPQVAGPQMADPQWAAPPMTSLPQAQFPGPPNSPETKPTGTTFYVGGGTRAVQIRGRGNASPFVLRNFDRPETGETVVLAQGGVTVEIQDVSAQMPNGMLMDFGNVTLSADRIVGWLPPLTGLFSGTIDPSSVDGELYLEGDIVFQQGQRTIFAESMYYNIAAQRGVVLDAEAITTIPNYQGKVRLKAKILQQISAGNFQAFDAAVTTSRMGVPRYWLQSEQLQLTDRQRLRTDPATQSQVVETDPFIKSSGNFLYAGGFPLLYWPTLATSLEKPTYYLTGIDIGNDSNFGTQVMLDFDLFQLFGIDDAPSGVDWELSTDYLSDRGPALGTSLDYNLPGLFGVSGTVNGNFDAWGIDDSGTDNLGSDRENLDPEESLRGRVLLRHRHYLPRDYEFVAEVGYLSDRNFLEQYLENEWDQNVDHRTALRLRKYFHNNLFDLSAQVQLNDFYTETERLPQLDHYLLGGSFFGDRFTYSGHNRIGYAKLNAAQNPINAAEAAEYFAVPGDTQQEGIVATTKHEIALPVQLGPLKIVPNVGGEVSHYGEAIDGDSLTRLAGQAGIRASLPMWRVDPTIQSSLLNVRGLAHKIEWTAEYLFADSDTNADEIPYYDPLDDNAQEQFRRRFIGDIYNGALPSRFDPRNYAFRQGIQSRVTSPSDVIVDDLQQVRLGLHQRFQTKRGLPGRERIVDLFQFDIDTILFPEANRDNFGETVGPTTYEMRYHLGDRVTLLSDGYIDFFDDGLRSISAGVRSSRPGLGEFYVGLLSLEGPISSTVLSSTVDYRLNEKWIASAGTTYDFGSTGNVGQSFGLTRIGESMLLRLGVNVDAGRDNVGFGFAIEPRFFPRPKLGRLAGQFIPPPGVEGLE